MRVGASQSGKPPGAGHATKRLLTVFPWQFRLAKQFIRMRLPGAYRFLSVMDHLGVLDVVVRHRLSETVTFDIPLYRKDNRWDGRDITEYALVEVQLMSSLAESFGDPVIMIDCGADIGILTVMFAAYCSLLKQVWAFEPNPAAFATLEANIARLPQNESKAICAAVANFRGTGELRSPEHSASDHAKFIVPVPGGSIPVVRIDDFNFDVSGTLLLKLDLEGGEMDAVLGALTTLSRAKNFIIHIESHPVQVRRTGTDAVEILRFLTRIRPCRIQITDPPFSTITTERSVLSQLDDDKMHNILCTSLP
jgi:FkbM family methyltransferase